MIVVNDRGGEFAAEGIGWLSIHGDWRYRFSIQPRANATPLLEQALQQLARPDAQGSYHFEGSGRL